VNLATIKAALSAWVVAATSYPAEQVVWTQQTVDLRLPQPYVTLAINSIRQNGQPQIRTEERTGTVAEGEELVVYADTWHDLAVRVQAWGEDPVSALIDVQSKAALPTIQAALRAANIGLGDWSDVTELGSVPGPGPDHRALFTIKMSVANTVSEYCGYWDWVTVADGLMTPTTYIDVNEPAPSA